MIKCKCVHTCGSIQNLLSALTTLADVCVIRKKKNSFEYYKVN